MKNILWKRGIVIGIIMLFIGASVLPHIVINVKADPAVIFSDDFNDNSKDYSKWTEIFTDGIWEEINGRTELKCYEGIPTNSEGIKSTDIETEITTLNPLLVSCDMISDVGHYGGFVGEFGIIVADGSNSISVTYYRRPNDLIVSDSNGGSYTLNSNKPEERRPWDVTFEIYSDKYKVIVDGDDSGWISESIFSGSSNIRMSLRMAINGNYPSYWWKVGFDNVLVQGTSGVNQLPVAEFTWSPTNPSPGETVTFDSSGSYDPDGSIVQRSWDFENDGIDDSWSTIATHTYTSPGTYDCELWVKDNDGGQKTVHHFITVGGGNQLVADAGGPYSGDIGENIQFTGSASGGTPPYSYAWDLDNNGQYDDATGATASKSWSTAGTYAIGLEVIDDNSNTDVNTATVTISSVGQSGPIIDETRILRKDELMYTVYYNDGCKLLWKDQEGQSHIPNTPTLYTHMESYQDFFFKIAAGDWNGDGKDDIAVMDRNWDEYGFYIYDMDGNLMNSWEGDYLESIFDLDMGDFNGDGIDDLITWDELEYNGEWGWMPRWYDQDENSHLVLTRRWEHWNIDLGDIESPYISAGDINGDGVDEIAVAGWDKNWDDGREIVLYWVYDPSGNTSHENGMTVDINAIGNPDDDDIQVNVRDIDFGDFDGDGLDELMYLEWVDPYVNIHIFDPIELWDIIITLDDDSTDYACLDSGDWNSDGYDDIALWEFIYCGGTEVDMKIYSVYDLNGNGDMDDVLYQDTMSRLDFEMGDFLGDSVEIHYTGEHWPASYTNNVVTRLNLVPYQNNPDIPTEILNEPETSILSEYGEGYGVSKTESKCTMYKVGTIWGLEADFIVAKAGIEVKVERSWNFEDFETTELMVFDSTRADDPNNDDTNLNEGDVLVLHSCDFEVYKYVCEGGYLDGKIFEVFVPVDKDGDGTYVTTAKQTLDYYNEQCELGGHPEDKIEVGHGYGEIPEYHHLNRIPEEWRDEAYDVNGDGGDPNYIDYLEENCVADGPNGKQWIFNGDKNNNDVIGDGGDLFDVCGVSWPGHLYMSEIEEHKKSTFLDISAKVYGKVGIGTAGITGGGGWGNSTTVSTTETLQATWNAGKLHSDYMDPSEKGDYSYSYFPVVYMHQDGYVVIDFLIAWNGTAYLGSNDVEIHAYCPVDLQVTDPLGHVIDKNNSDIPGSVYYDEYDLNDDGDPDDKIFIPDALSGEYIIEVIPEPDADPTDTYSIQVFSEGNSYYLVEDEQIQNIPSEPYTIEYGPPITIKTIGDPKYGDSDEWVTSDTEFNLTATDNISGVNKTYYRTWYNDSWTLWMEYANNFTLSDEGMHYIEYYSTDLAGNTEEVHNQTHYVDDTPPQIVDLFLPADPIQIGTPVELNAIFFDELYADAHSATIDWGDGNTTSGTVDETNQTATGNWSYAQSGVYAVNLTVEDYFGRTDSEIFQYVVVYDPGCGFATGGGWIDSPSGAYIPNASLVGKANFGFVSKYKKGHTIPTGNTQFNFQEADLNFHSDNYQWMVIIGSCAIYKGSGTINGEGDYRFIVTVFDGAEDMFGIKIYDNSNVIYDSGLIPLGGGQIKIHK